MIGVAVIGYGYWGPNLARCFSETEDCRVAAIADPSMDALAMVRRALRPFPHTVPAPFLSPPATPLAQER